jgi:hypothetical protein
MIDDTTDDIPILKVRHADRHAWTVAATWPGGRFEEIEGFKTESEANEWTARSLRAWIDGSRRGAQEADASVPPPNR